MRPLYVAATGQHVGKTTSTLGLATNILDKGLNVGYCKPVGQKHVSINEQVVDKDVALFAQLLKFPIEASVHSSIVMEKGFTKMYLDNPDKYDLKSRILHSAGILGSRHEIVIYEGTGHPGVGSVANVSNADVARILKAGVIMVAEGGIGNTIDRLTLSIAQFRQYKVPILGVIVNKVLPEKLDQVQHYVGKKLNQINLELLGVVPFDKHLSFPIIQTIKHAIRGKFLFHEGKLGNRVESIIAGSLVDIEEFSTFSNLLLVVSFRRLDEAIQKVKSISRMKDLEKPPISGIIITGDGKHEKQSNISPLCLRYIMDNEIPVISTELDTYGSVVKISRIEVKINTRTPWKTRRAIELIKENVDIDQILNKLEMVRYHE